MGTVFLAEPILRPAKEPPLQREFQQATGQAYSQARHKLFPHLQGRSLAHKTYRLCRFCTVLTRRIGMPTLRAAMSTHAGVGFSEQSHSDKAAIEATRAALAEARTDRCDLAMLFHTAKHDPSTFHRAVRSVVGPQTRLIGGYAGGIITRNHLGYDGYQCGVAVLQSDTVAADLFVEYRLNERGEHEVGRALGSQIRHRGYDVHAGLLYMYDSVKRFSPVGGFDMNIATYLVQGMAETIGGWPNAAGMGMIGNIQFNPTFQYFDDQVNQQTAMAIVFHGPCRLDTIIMHGCRPASGYHTVTRADRNVVLEIDGRPALDVIAKILGPESDRGWEDYPLFVTLGVNKGDKFGDYDDEAYANRLCMAIDRERRGLVMFEPDLTPGTEIQLMRRSIDFEYIHSRARRLYGELGDRTPFLGIYIDCMGRAGSYCGSAGEEGTEIQKAIGSHMPLLGMYTGVEIGNVAGRQQPLDWSGVLCVFSE